MRKKLRIVMVSILAIVWMVVLSLIQENLVLDMINFWCQRAIQVEMTSWQLNIVVWGSEERF